MPPAITTRTNGTNDDDKKTWPQVSYLTYAEKYTGAGEITKVNTWDDGSNGIYINNATSEAVSAYRTQLKNAGWTLSVGPVNNADNTAWGYTKGEATCSIRLYSSIQTEERISGNYSFNLYIGFENDGVIVNPGGNTLSVPTVSINNSGLASWSAVTNASGYKYKINGGAETATNSLSVQLTNGQSIQVKAVGSGTYSDSAYSASQTYTGGGGNPDTITVNDFAYDLGNHYYISSQWNVTGYDNNDQEYVYQEYRKIALIGGVYFVETYDFNYEKSNAQGNFAQAFYIPNGSDYKLYSRQDTNEAFELISSVTTSNEVSNAISIALGETSIKRATTYVTANTLQYITRCATTTHEATGRTIIKYSHGTAGTTLYEYYIDSATKACIEFFDYVADGHINLSVFSTSGNAWGTSGLPALPGGETPEPTALAVPVITINSSGLASWAEVTNATSYKIKINGGTEEFAVGLSEQLNDGDTIQVKAIGDGETYSDSAFSAVQTYTAQGDPQPTALTAPVVSINESGLASWSAVSNASGYKYKINNGTETATNNLSIQLSDGQSIVVKAVGNGTTYSDSAYSVSETYTAVSATQTWPSSTKLAEYGFGGIAKPNGATISLVGETEATAEAPKCLTIVISNGTDTMFDTLTTALFSAGATVGVDGTGAFTSSSKTQLIATTSSLSSFMGMEATATADLYYGVNVEYYITAGVDKENYPVAAQTFIISFAEVDLSASTEPTYADYINLPNKFTITYNTSMDGETKTLIKDGDKLYWRVVSKYENRERLAIKQSDGTYKIYERDNKLGAGSWDMDYVPEYDDIYFALEALDSNFFAYAQREMSGSTPISTGSGTVAGMICNVYNYVDGSYTYSYYCYSGLAFKVSEHNNGQTVVFEVETYSASADLSGYTI